MEERKNPLKNAKVEVRPASNVLKIVLIALIVFSMAALIALRWVHGGILSEISGLKEEASGLEYANSQLTEKIGDLGSIQSIQDISKEELGLVDPDTIIIDPE